LSYEELEYCKAHGARDVSSKYLKHSYIFHVHLPSILPFPIFNLMLEDFRHIYLVLRGVIEVSIFVGFRTIDNL